MNIYLILAGYGIGLTLAAPGGPVNILCVQRTLAHGYWAGLAVGLGAVLGDALLALIAASGLSVVAHFLQTFVSEIQIVGGVILMAFGLKLIRTGINERTASSIAGVDEDGPQRPAILREHLHAIPQSFLLTVTNPGAMLGVFALFGGLASVFGAFPTMTDVFIIVLAVVAGNLTWWFGLTHMVSRFRHRVCTERLKTVNRLAGFALMAFGAVLLVRGGATIDTDRLTAAFPTPAIAAFVRA